VGGTAAIWLSVVLLNPLFGGSGLHLPEFSLDLLVCLVISFVLLFLVNSEELVWRGSLLPRLQARWSALGASVFIGIFEGLFHLPLFFKPDSDQAAAGLPVFAVGSIAGAVQHRNPVALQRPVGGDRFDRHGRQRRAAPVPHCNIRAARDQWRVVRPTDGHPSMSHPEFAQRHDHRASAKAKRRACSVDPHPLDTHQRTPMGAHPSAQGT
jgi:hypothetical protein